METKTDNLLRVANTIITFQADTNGREAADIEAANDFAIPEDSGIFSVRMKRDNREHWNVEVTGYFHDDGHFDDACGTHGRLDVTLPNGIHYSGILVLSTVELIADADGNVRERLNLNAGDMPGNSGLYVIRYTFSSDDNDNTWFRRVE